MQARQASGSPVPRGATAFCFRQRLILRRPTPNGLKVHTHTNCVAAIFMMAVGRGDCSISSSTSTTTAASSFASGIPPQPASTAAVRHPQHQSVNFNSNQPQQQSVYLNISYAQQPVTTNRSIHSQQQSANKPQQQSVNLNSSQPTTFP